MSEETKIGIKMEEETKPLKKLCEKLEESIGAEFNKGIEQIDVEEMGKAIDMLKDLYEAKKYMLEGCYFKSVVSAMEEYGEDEEMEDDERRGYRGQPRSASGRFMSRGDGRRSNRGRGSRRGYESPMMEYDDMDYEDMQYMRDMDRPYGRMGYSGSGSSGGSSMVGSTSGNSSMNSGSSNMGYSESGSNYGSRMQRESREGKSGQMRRGYIEAKEQGKDKTEKMKSLEDYMKSMAEDLTEAIENASPEERSMVKNKLSVLTQKM